VTVRDLRDLRDLRDVAASFERLWRKTSALNQVPVEANNLVKSKTALGRFQVFIDDAQPVGRAFNATKDALTRGWRDSLHFIDYDDLAATPGQVLARVYRFLGEPPFEHDFEHVEQLTFEDDYAYGFKDLHRIRAKVEPQPPQWPKVYDSAVFQSQEWKNVERPRPLMA
jgi:sulfotransferase